MQNIPLIPQTLSRDLTHRRRARKLSENTDATNSVPPVKPRRERRKKHERRQTQLKVIFDRRQRGLHRRKKSLTHTDSASVSDTIGKHINTTA